MYLFDEKQYGRIFTDKEENIQKIKDIIKEIDEFEYGYLPDNLIMVYDGKFSTIYNGKFYMIELNELVNKCKDQKITCGVIKAHQDYTWQYDTPILDQESFQNCIRNFYETGFWSKNQVLQQYKLDYLI